jgi:hypothetical protein
MVGRTMIGWRKLVAGILAVAALLLLAAVGCKVKSGDEDAVGETPATEETATMDEADTPTAPPENGARDTGSVSIAVFGEVSGDLNLVGMSCFYFPNTPDDWYRAQIVGTVDEEVYTIDAIAYESSPTPPTARLVRNRDNAVWQPEEDGTADSDTLMVTAEGGDLSFSLPAVENSPAPAASEVHVEGSWTCPDGAYTTVDQ